MVTGPLNYEAMDEKQNGSFSLMVVARDMGTPSLSTSVLALINVQVKNVVIFFVNAFCIYIYIYLIYSTKTLVLSCVAAPAQVITPNSALLTSAFVWSVA